MSNSNVFAQRLKDIGLSLEQEHDVMTLCLNLLEDDTLKEALHKLVDYTLEEFSQHMS